MTKIAAGGDPRRTMTLLWRSPTAPAPGRPGPEGVPQRRCDHRHRDRPGGRGGRRGRVVARRRRTAGLHADGPVHVRRGPARAAGPHVRPRPRDAPRAGGRRLARGRGWASASSTATSATRGSSRSRSRDRCSGRTSSGRSSCCWRRSRRPASTPRTPRARRRAVRPRPLDGLDDRRRATVGRGQRRARLVGRPDRGAQRRRARLRRAVPPFRGAGGRRAGRRRRRPGDRGAAPGAGDRRGSSSRPATPSPARSRCCSTVPRRRPRAARPSRLRPSARPLAATGHRSTPSSPRSAGTPPRRRRRTCRAPGHAAPTRPRGAGGSSCSRRNASRSSYCDGLPETSSRSRAASHVPSRRVHRTTWTSSAASRASSQPKSTSPAVRLQLVCPGREVGVKRSMIQELAAAGLRSGAPRRRTRRARAPPPLAPRT